MNPDPKLICDHTSALTSLLARILRATYDDEISGRAADGIRGIVSAAVPHVDAIRATCTVTPPPAGDDRLTGHEIPIPGT